MAASYFAPHAALTGQALPLTMQSLFLTGRLLPFGAKLTVRHAFCNAETSPVEAVYSFALPRDASLVKFRVNADTFSVDSKLEPTAKAVRTYENAVAAGSFAALAREHADGLINLSLGNLRPRERVIVTLDLIAGVEMSDDGLRLRFPFALAPNYHSRARVVPIDFKSFEMDIPNGILGDAMLPTFHADAHNLHQIGFSLSVEPKSGVREVSSPSHHVRLDLSSEMGFGVSLANDRDLPNRDLVLDVKTEAKPLAWYARPERNTTTIFLRAPSSVFGESPKGSRRIVFVLDRSGSMEGTPLAQAKSALEKCLPKLNADDSFGLLDFGTDTQEFRPQLTPATPENVARASEHLRHIEANGGTELLNALLVAAKVLENKPGEIFLITDGQVFSTNHIIQQLAKSGVRVHCLGIGSASQDRFLALLTRSTGGVSRFLTPDERIDNALDQLFAATGGALAEQLHLASGKFLPNVNSVFSKTPLQAFGEVPSDTQQLSLRWNNGKLNVDLTQLDSEISTLLRQLQGARLITDLDATYDSSNKSLVAEMRKLSETYELTSKEMSLVAVFKRPDDDPHQVPLMRPVGVGLPETQEMSPALGRRRTLITGVLACRLPSSLAPLPVGFPTTPPPSPSLEILISQAVALFDQNTADTKEKLALSQELKTKMDDASLPSRKRRWLKKLCALLEKPQLNPKDWQSLRRHIRAEFPNANIADPLATAKASG